MEVLIILLAIVAILIATSYKREHMTNDDVMKALQKYGTADEPKKKKDSNIESKQTIYGPHAKQPPAEPSPTSHSGSKDRNQHTGSYPQIYGPDIPMIPGKRPSRPKHESDKTDEETFDYNPDLQKAFPQEGPPQPFLTDFAPFQR